MANVSINFNKMDKAGLRPIANQFTIQGNLKIPEIESNNKAVRESGFLVKTAKFVFESGQVLLLRVKADGTIFQVKLNNKVLPVKNVDDMSKAIDEIMEHIKANEKKYVKAKEKRIATAAKADLAKQPKVTVTRRHKLEQAESRLSELTAEKEDLEKKIESFQTNAITKSNQLSELSEKLKSLQERGKELENELTGIKAELGEVA